MSFKNGLTLTSYFFFEDNTSEITSYFSLYFMNAQNIHYFVKENNYLCYDNRLHVLSLILWYVALANTISTDKGKKVT